MQVEGVLENNKLIIKAKYDSEENNNIVARFNKKLEILNSIFEETEKEMAYSNKDFTDILNKSIENIKNTEEAKYNTLMAVETFKNNSMKEEIQELKKRKTELEDILINNNTISSKGIEGELYVEEYIRERIKLNPKWHITNISKDGNHNSDLEMQYKSIKCVIEVKNIKSKLSDSNIKKFRETYINSPEKEYTSGMFVSLLSDYSHSSNVYDFCIQTINNKHIIFLSKVKENPEKMLFAMEILDQLNKIKSRTDNKMLVELINKQIKNYGNLYSEINKSLSAIKDMKSSIKIYQTEIINFIEDFRLE
jgi:hypothetical protein